MKLRLRRLSDNCGGKVLGVAQGTAVLRFGSAEAAARAHKRMENEDVFGRRISVSFSPRPRDDASPEPEPESRPHPLTLAQTGQNQDLMFESPLSLSTSAFLPLGMQRSPRRPRRATRPSHASGPLPERPYSPRRGCSGPPGGAPAKPHQVSRLVGACFPHNLRRPLSLSGLQPSVPLTAALTNRLELHTKLHLSACASMH